MSYEAIASSPASYRPCPFAVSSELPLCMSNMILLSFDRVLLAMPSVEFLAYFDSRSPKLLLQFLYPEVLINLKKKQAVNIMLGILKHTMSTLSLPSVVPGLFCSLSSSLLIGLIKS